MVNLKVLRTVAKVGKSGLRPLGRVLHGTLKYGGPLAMVGMGAYSIFNDVTDENKSTVTKTGDVIIDVAVDAAEAATRLAVRLAARAAANFFGTMVGEAIAVGLTAILPPPLDPAAFAVLGPLMEFAVGGLAAWAATEGMEALHEWWDHHGEETWNHIKHAAKVVADACSHAAHAVVDGIEDAGRFIYDETGELVNFIGNTADNVAKSIHDAVAHDIQCGGNTSQSECNGHMLCKWCNKHNHCYNKLTYNCDCYNDNTQYPHHAEFSCNLGPGCLWCAGKCQTTGGAVY